MTLFVPEGIHFNLKQYDRTVHELYSIDKMSWIHNVLFIL